MTQTQPANRSKQQQAQHTPGASLVRRLRETTRLMASRITAPQGLWNEHSNACLQAADAIDQLETLNAELLAALKDVLNELRKNMPEGDPDHGTTPTDQKIRRFLKLDSRACAAIAKAESR